MHVTFDPTTSRRMCKCRPTQHWADCE